MTKVSAVLPDTLQASLEQRARAEDRSMSAEIRRALAAYLASPSRGARGEPAVTTMAAGSTIAPTSEA